MLTGGDPGVDQASTWACKLHADADPWSMEQVERLTDTDVVSLDERIAKVVERCGGDCVVKRYTHWFTGRLPVHEALVLRQG